MYGIIIGLISAGMLAASMIMIKKCTEEPTALFSLMFYFEFKWCDCLNCSFVDFNSDNLYPTTFTDWGLVFIYGAVMQCVAWGMIAYTIPYLSLGLTGLLLLSEPVVALVIDYFGLDKPINHWQWAGAVLTLVAIYLGSQKQNHLKQKSAVNFTALCLHIKPITQLLSFQVLIELVFNP